MDADLRVAVVHNLLRGGARRRLQEQIQHLDATVAEFTLSSATPVTPTPVLVDADQRAERMSRWIRPFPRYLDVERLAGAWEHLFTTVGCWRPDVVFLNPCHLMHSPVLPKRWGPPTVYFCDEPRRVDYEKLARASTNPRTRALYAGMRRRQKKLDRRSVERADMLLTNSAWTARQIFQAYGREATPIDLGVAEAFHAGVHRHAEHVLSVGTLIPSKGHDLAIRAVADSGVRLPLVVVAPRESAGETGRLRALADAAGVNLDLRIGISDTELADLYGGAMATLYLARDEPLGLASLESQACGTPVVVVAEGGLPETIREGVTGWAVPRSGGASDRLSSLAAGTMRDDMFRNTTAHGSTYTWEASTALIDEALRTAAAKPAKAVA